jgi:outer membrane immunogenic protein
MRKMLLAGATASLVLGAVQAQAADMAVKARPYAAPVAAFSWSGAYIGGNVGGIWGQHRDDVNGVLISGTGADCAFATSCGISNSSGWSSSVIGGIETGYRFQHGMWVLGFEQDIRWTNLRNTFTVGAPTPAGAFVAVPGGPVVAGIDDAHKYHFGYTIGGGAQYAFTDTVSLGVEYRYTKLNNETYNLGTVIGPGASVRPVFANVDFRSSEILGRLDIKFNYLTGLFGLGAL